MIGGIMIGFVKKNRFQFVLVLLLFLSSCTIGGVNPATPPIEFEKANINNQFTLFVDDTVNLYKISEPIFINLAFHTTNIIKFPNNYNIRIFVLDDGF
jgi:hypothetical protein